jgi:NAD-dependent dihydropyrimidine dehydrogenase PreA subunit
VVSMWREEGYRVAKGEERATRTRCQGQMCARQVGTPPHTSAKRGEMMVEIQSFSICEIPELRCPVTF